MYYLLLAAIVWLADRITKILVSQRFALWSTRPLLGRWLSLTYVHNTGAAFGLFRNQVLLLSLVNIAILLSLLFFRRYVAVLSKWGKLGIALVAAGALGNLYDRIFYGYVIDFLELPYWPVFNVADSAIVAGVALLGVGIWTWDGEAKRSAHSSTDS